MEEGIIEVNNKDLVDCPKHPETFLPTQSFQIPCITFTFNNNFIQLSLRFATAIKNIQDVRKKSFTSLASLIRSWSRFDFISLVREELL